MRDEPTNTTTFVPDFFLLGAQKCATTSLAGALGTHPDVFMPPTKGANHFGNVPDRDAAGPAYARVFAGRAGQRVAGEATSNYLVRPGARRQILRVAPAARMVVVVRHPVDRAYSAWWHGLRVGLLHGSFEDVLAAERPGRPGEGFRDLVGGGRYAEHLRAWLDEGLDRDRLHVALFDDLIDDPATTLASIQQFLGVDPEVDAIPHLNGEQRSRLPGPARRVLFRWRGLRPVQVLIDRTTVAMEPPPMRPATRRMLLDTFAAPNADLRELLGVDLLAWDR